MTQDTEAERVFRWNFEIHASPSGGWVRSEDHDMAIRALAAERDALRDAIEAADRLAAWAKEIEGRTASRTCRRIVLERDIVGLLTALDDYRAAFTGEAKP